MQFLTCIGTKPVKLVRLCGTHGTSGTMEISNHTRTKVWAFAYFDITLRKDYDYEEFSSHL